MQKNYGYVLLVVLAITIVGGTVLLHFLQQRMLVKSRATTIPETIELHREQNQEDVTYKIDLASGSTTPQRNIYKQITSYLGMPTLQKTSSVEDVVSTIRESQNHQQVLVIVDTLDSAARPNGFDGSLPVLKSTGYRCVIAIQTCVPSTILIMADAKYPSIGWYGWDSDRNMLFGHLTGEGWGSSSPVIVYSGTTGKVRETPQYDQLRGGLRASVPAGAFSPQLDKFVMLASTTLLVYSFDDLTKPIRTIDLSSILSANSDLNCIDWSEDENTIALGFDKQIYQLDLQSRTLKLLFNDLTETSIGYWDRNALQFSSGGSFLVFVDYESVPGEKLYSGLFTSILKSIDLKSGQVREIFRETSDHLTMSIQSH